VEGGCIGDLPGVGERVEGGQLRFSRRLRGSSGWSQKYGDSVPSVHAWGRYLVAGQREES